MPTVACAGARLSGNSRRWHGLRRGRGFDLEQKAVNPAYHDGLPDRDVGGGDGVPEFAVNEYLSARGKRGLGDAGFTDQSLRAGDQFITARFESDAHQERGDQSQGNADGQRGQQVDAHFRDRRIDEQQSPESEQCDAADSKHAVSGELGFGGEKRECGENQAQRGKARGQQIEGEGCDQDEDDANGAGNDGAGMIEFGIERERADSEQYEGDVRIHQIVEDVLFQRHAERHRWAGPTV